MSKQELDGICILSMFWQMDTSECAGSDYCHLKVVMIECKVYETYAGFGEGICQGPPEE